tara:strand:+ start:1363 stop:3297 length:1935 start_codon:yes stop_codon:yes gene_type:complete
MTDAFSRQLVQRLLLDFESKKKIQLKKDNALAHQLQQEEFFETEEQALERALEQSLENSLVPAIFKDPDESSLESALKTAKSNLRPVDEKVKNIYASNLKLPAFREIPAIFGRSVLTRDWGNQFDTVKKLFGQVSDNRQELEEIRAKHIARFKELQTEENPDYRELTKAITKDTISYFNKRVQRLIEKLGPAPTKFSLFSLGSMPREESGFYTDLEIGILLDKNTPAAQKYFQKLVQLLSDELFLLGEHPDVGGKGLRIDEADNAPSHMRWFSRHASPEQARDIISDGLANRKIGKKFPVPYEGSRIFLVTPERFAQYSDPDFIAKEKKKNTYKARKKRIIFERRLIQKEFRKARRLAARKGLSHHEVYQDISRYVKDAIRPFSTRECNQVQNTRSLVRNITPIYGDDRVFNRYIEARARYLEKRSPSLSPLVETERHSLVVQKFTEDMIRYAGDDKNPIMTGVLGDTIDLKRQFYRMPEQILTNLGFYFNLSQQNCQDIAMALVQRGFFSETIGTQFKAWMNYATGLRLKGQVNVNKQGFAIPTTQEEYSDQLEDLEKEKEALNRQHDLVIEIHGTSLQRHEIEERRNAVIKDIKRLKKQEPLTKESVLSEEERKRLTAFLPACKKLFERTIDFLKGNWAAYR